MHLSTSDNRKRQISPIILGQVNFSCPQLPPLSQSAKNVYELRPQDIKVVMAIGDSITAGKKRVTIDALTIVIILANYLQVLECLAVVVVCENSG